MLTALVCMCVIITTLRNIYIQALDACAREADAAMATSPTFVEARAKSMTAVARISTTGARVSDASVSSSRTGNLTNIDDGTLPTDLTMNSGSYNISLFSDDTHALEDFVFYESSEEQPYPYETKTFTARVISGPENDGVWFPSDWRFSMTVHYPAAIRPGRCKPVVVLNHPVQVFNAGPGTEYWNQCEHLAGQGFICVLSREGNGQFGLDSDDETAQMSSYRALAMFRNLRQIYHNDPSSDLYNAVCNKFCAMGYSIGGCTSINMAVFRSSNENMRCIVALHPAPTTQTKADAVDVPMLVGGGRNDTLTPVEESLGLFQNSDIPWIFPVIKEGNHISGECGNLCPVILRCCYLGLSNTVDHYPWATAYLRMHLFDEDHLAPLIWNPPGVTEGGLGISAWPDIHSVYRFPRVTVSALFFGTLDFIGRESKTVTVLSVINSGRPSTYKLVLASAKGDEGCEDIRLESSTEAEVAPGFPVDFQATFNAASVRGTGECTLSFRAFDVEQKVLTGVVEFGTTKEPCVITEWSEWTTDTCGCCQGGSMFEARSFAATSRKRANARGWARSSQPVPALARAAELSGIEREEVRSWAEVVARSIPGSFDATMGFLEWDWEAPARRSDSAALAALEKSAVAELVAGAAALKSASVPFESCTSVFAFIDGNNDGVVSEIEASTILTEMRLWLTSEADPALYERASSTLGSVSRSAAASRSAVARDDNDTGIAPGADVDTSSVTFNALCKRTRTVIGSTLEDMECVIHLGDPKLVKYRGCTPATDPLCYVTISPPPPPRRAPSPPVTGGGGGIAPPPTRPGGGTRPGAGQSTFT